MIISQNSSSLCLLFSVQLEDGSSCAAGYRQPWGSGRRGSFTQSDVPLQIMCSPVVRGLRNESGGASGILGGLWPLLSHDSCLWSQHIWVNYAPSEGMNIFKPPCECPSTFPEGSFHVWASCVRGGHWHDKKHYPTTQDLHPTGFLLSWRHRQRNGSSGGRLRKCLQFGHWWATPRAREALWVCTSLQPWAFTGEVILSLHSALVKPHLEYCIPAQGQREPVRVGSEEGHENGVLEYLSRETRLRELGLLHL